MCRIEVKTYVNRAGNRKTSENTFFCERSSHRRLCSNVSRHHAGYCPMSAGFSDSASSLAPSSPITPNGSNTYIVEPRQPSAPGGRPSTRDGIQTVKPELVIEFGSKSKKGGPSIKISAPKARNISSGSSAVYSDSDGSHTVRTGFPDETNLPSYASGSHLPTPRHGRQPSAGSSFTTSSGTPSYVSSDYDYESPRSHAEASYSRPVIHNPSPVTARHGLSGSPPSPYNTNIIHPNSAATRGRPSLDGFRSEGSTSSRGSSRLSRDADRTRGKRKEEEPKYEDEDDENTKQVRFQLGREKMRAQERNENMLAEKEKQRAEYREDKRKQAKEREEKLERETRREKASRQQTAEPSRQSRTRRPSMTAAQEEERRRLILADTDHMTREQRNVEALEREEELFKMHEKQQTLDYYSTRSNPPALTRRDSTSGTAPPSLSRSGNRHNVVTQPNVPSTTRPGSSHRQHAPPPAAFYNSGRAGHTSRRPSSSHQERPNLFVQTASQTSADSWDTQAMRDALPSARYPSDGRYNTQQPDSHTRAQQASGSMHRAFGYGGGFPPA